MKKLVWFGYEESTTKHITLILAWVMYIYLDIKHRKTDFFLELSFFITGW